MLDHRTSYGAGLALPKYYIADLTLLSLVFARCQWLNPVTRCQRCFAVESCTRVVQRAGVESAECTDVTLGKSSLVVTPICTCTK
jgi:hypothetical protein